MTTFLGYIADMAIIVSGGDFGFSIESLLHLEHTAPPLFCRGIDTSFIRTRRHFAKSVHFVATCRKPSSYAPFKAQQQPLNWFRYWDWSLDWEHLPSAPLWDVDLGFGGNGNSSDTKSVAHGYCVTEGPFAHLQVMNYGREHRPHCLSREFLADKGELRARGNSSALKH